MERLKEIIRSNIEWFWKNDPCIWCDDGGMYKEEPTVINENNVKEIWNCFKVWCVQNCMEVLENEGIEIQEEQIIKEIDDMYNEWVNSR